jgi:hypothetical protein
VSDLIHSPFVIAPVVRVPVERVSFDHAISNELAIKFCACSPLNLASKRVWIELG